jgi:hypothetical protein
LAVGVDLVDEEGRLEQDAQAMGALLVVDLHAHIDSPRSCSPTLEHCSGWYGEQTRRREGCVPLVKRKNVFTSRVGPKSVLVCSHDPVSE